MSAPPGREFFSSGEKENADIAVLCRGFLTTLGGKKAVVVRDANKVAVP